MSIPGAQAFAEVSRPTRLADAIAGPLGTGTDRDIGGEQATLILDAGGGIRFCSSAAARLFGASAVELVETSIASLIPDLATEGAAVADASRAAGGRRGTEGAWRTYLALGRDGMAFSLDVALCRLPVGNAHLLVMTLARSAVPTQGDDHLPRLVSRLEHSADAAVVTDLDGLIEHVNPAFEAMTGYSRRDALGRSTRILKSGVHSPEFYAELWATIRSGQEFSGVLVNRKRNGELFHEEKRIRQFVNAAGNATHYVSIGHDVSGRAQALDRLERMDNYDRVTGMPARNLLLDRLEQTLVHAARRGTGAALVCVNLDDFKAVNERHGRGVGDALLRAVAHRLRECVRREDTVARLRGDQFAIVLVDAAERGDAEKVLEKIMASFARGFRIGAEGFNVSASVGACLFPNQARDKRGLLAGADAAVHSVKASGGNAYRFFEEEGNEPKRERVTRQRRVDPCAQEA